MIKKETFYLNRLIESREFRFDRLELEGIDNSPAISDYGSEMIEQETCLFHRDVSSGEDYFEMLHTFIGKGLSEGNAAPVVRFADGEYAFYADSLDCNGLYQQAESVDAIKKIMPIHIEALKILSQKGKLAPLIYPGNIQDKRKNLFQFFLAKYRSNDSALRFVELLFYNKIKLTGINYVPFYIVYAYLTSKRFIETVDDKKLCIINSKCNIDSCRQWFARFSSYPNIAFTEIPGSYMATQWESIKKDVFNKIPPESDICLVGAGIGSLLVCVDVAQEFSIPVIDAGHVLNMINNCEDKSGGARLYTIYKT
jgi:hypothetical protein